MESTNSASEDTIIYDKGTGNDEVRIHRIITYPIGHYEIKVELDEENKFIGISEVRINKDFRNYYQKMPKGFHDVNKYYED